MYILRYNTDSTIKIGPLVSAGDGVTIVTGLGYDLSAARVSKNGGAFALRSNYSNLSATHDVNQNGYFNLGISASDLSTLGNLRVAYTGPTSTCVPLWEDCWVMTSGTYDAYFSTSALNVNVTTWLGSTPNALNSGFVPSNLGQINSSTVELHKFIMGASHVLSATVTSANFTPTTTQFEVSGLPTLGNVNNLNGRAIYWRSGVLNEFKSTLYALTDQGGGVYRVTISPAAPTLPVNSDTINVI